MHLYCTEISAHSHTSPYGGIIHTVAKSSNTFNSHHCGASTSWVIL